MKATLTFSPSAHTDKNGTTPLYVRVAADKKKKFYPVGLRVKPSDFNESSRTLKTTYPDAAIYNVKLAKIMSAVTVGLMENPNMDIQATINNIFYDFNPDAVEQKISSPTTQNSLIDYAHEYVERCKRGKILKQRDNQPMTAGYLRAINVSVARLKNFEAYIGEKITLESVNLEWYNELITYLRFECENEGAEGNEKGLSENSIAITTKVLKTLMYQAVRDKKTTNIDFQDFTVSFKDVDNIYLTEEEVQKILDLNLPFGSQLQREQERFSLAYNLFLRFSDSMNLDPKYIIVSDGKPMIKMITAKTQTEVIVPLTAKNYDILTRPGFKLSGANAMSNRDLKKLGQLAGINTPVTIYEYKKGKRFPKTYEKWELITTHTTRRSAATNLYLAGADLDAIRQFGGWSNLLTLQKYLKISVQENASNMANHPFFK